MFDTRSIKLPPLLAELFRLLIKHASRQLSSLSQTLCSVCCYSWCCRLKIWWRSWRILNGCIANHKMSRKFGRQYFLFQFSRLLCFVSCPQLKGSQGTVRHAECTDNWVALPLLFSCIFIFWLILYLCYLLSLAYSAWRTCGILQHTFVLFAALGILAFYQPYMWQEAKAS